MTSTRTINPTGTEKMINDWVDEINNKFPVQRTSYTRYKIGYVFEHGIWWKTKTII